MTSIAFGYAFKKSYIGLLENSLQCTYFFYIYFILDMFGLQLGSAIYQTNSTGGHNCHCATPN